MIVHSILGYGLFLAFVITVCGEFISADYEEYNKGKLGHRPQHTFHSSSESSPVLQVNIWNTTRLPTTGSHIFLRHDGQTASESASPLILDARDLTTVYTNRSFENVFGTRVQENFGKKYLTFWAGEKPDTGIGDGFGLAYDENYHLVYNISAQNLRVHSDLHEFLFTGHGTALMTGIDRKLADTSSWEGWEGHKEFPILGAVFQEIDLETNEVLFSWNALDHIDPMDSSAPWAGVHEWDAFHMNSVEKTHAGNYLISIRHMHYIMLIDGHNGAILWTLGGKRNDFDEIPPPDDVNTSSPLLDMGWQHHARFVPHTNETELTFFDNHVKDTSHGTCAETGSCSRGVHIRIDVTASPRPTAQLLREYLHPSQLQAQSQGSVQALAVSSDGVPESVFVGWGRCPSFTQHDAATGETLLDVQFSPWHSEEITNALDNYRAFRQDWTATPWWNPALALMESATEDALDVFVSWNGATEVREWVVRGVVVRGTNVSMVNGEGEVLGRSDRTGFETKLTIDMSGLWYMWAEAMDSEGNVIGRTERLNFETDDVAVLSFEPDEFEDGPDGESNGGRWFLLGGGGVGLVLVALWAKSFWLRCRNYELVDEDDIDLDSDSDGESVSGYDLFLGNDLGPEPWQDYSPRLSSRT